MKRFLIGFLVGLGLMHWYLQYADTMQSEARQWFERSGSNYRDDKMHRAANEALGDKTRRP
jgi:hypothetical protein